jgi:hypothetical protein
MLNNEVERLKAVRRFLTLKISRENELTEIARYAAEICYTPMAFITLLDEDTQHILFSIGSDLKRTRRKDSFCNYTIMQNEVLVIPDTGKDERFAGNPLRLGKTNIQFYAGAPLITKDGFNLGSLCVIDHTPKDLSDIQQKMLAVLSRQVIHILDFDFSLALLNEQYLEAKKTEIKLSSFFESSVSCHLLVGKDLEVLAFNKTLAEIMRINHGLEMHIGDSVIDYIDDVFFPEFLTNFKEALLGNHIQNESPMITGGKKIWWNYNYVPALDAEGEIIGVSYNAINISDLKLKEQQSNAKDESLRAIAFIQSHEIRRPVSSILGLMNLIKADGYESSKEHLMMMELAVLELDEKIRLIVNHTHNDDDYGVIM